MSPSSTEKTSQPGGSNPSKTTWSSTKPAKSSSPNLDFSMFCSKNLNFLLYYFNRTKLPNLPHNLPRAQGNSLFSLLFIKMKVFCQLCTRCNILIISIAQISNLLKFFPTVMFAIFQFSEMINKIFYIHRKSVFHLSGYCNGKHCYKNRSWGLS